MRLSNLTAKIILVILLFSPVYSSKVYALESSFDGCNEVLVGAVYGNGCAISLVTPTTCEEIDLTNGKLYQFAWTTLTPSGFTWCETPYRLTLAGTPASESNYHWWDFSAGSGSGWSATHENGGYVFISANTFPSSGLTSTTGIYHWVVAGWYGSHPPTQTFRIITDDARVRRISSATFLHNTIHAAYDKAVENDVIETQAATFTGALVFNKDIAVTLRGGYSVDFSTVTGVTTITDRLTINSGLVLIENFAIN